MEIAVAVLVEEPATLGARGLGDEDAGKGQTRGVVLDELHVLEGRARPIGQGHAVAVLDVGVGSEGEDLAAAARADDDGPGGDGQDLPRGQLDGHHPLAAALVHEELRDETLVVAADGLVLEAGLEEGVEHVEAGLVGGEPRPHLLHPAEGPHGDAAVGLAAPRAAPVLQPEHLLGGLPDERLDGVLVAQPVAPGDGVVGVLVQAVSGLDHRGRPPLRRDGVAAHGIDLGDHGHAQLRIHLGDGDGRA